MHQTNKLMYIRIRYLNFYLIYLNYLLINLFNLHDKSNKFGIC